MSQRMSHTLRLLLEAVLIGLLVGIAIIWWQSDEQRTTAPSSYALAVNRAAPAVVNIYTTRKVVSQPRYDSLLGHFLRTPRRARLQASLGSGVIVSAKGYVLTSYHVIKGGDAILVALRDGREAEAQIVGVDQATDLALLQIHLDDLPVIEIDEEQSVRVGDVVLAIGNPLGIGQTVTMGIVGATGRSHLGLATFENFIQTDAAINKGNSGGALVDTQGRLIGINTAILSNDGRWQGISFATPVAVAQAVMHDLIEYGHVVRGYLGVSVQNISAELALSLGLKSATGAVIAGVMRASPAAKAGIRPGDILLQINGQAIRGGYDAMSQVASSRPGDKMTFTLWRDGQRFSVSVTTGTRPQGMAFKN